MDKKKYRNENHIMGVGDHTGPCQKCHNERASKCHFSLSQLRKAGVLKGYRDKVGRKAGWIPFSVPFGVAFSRTGSICSKLLAYPGSGKCLGRVVRISPCGINPPCCPFRMSGRKLGWEGGYGNELPWGGLSGESEGGDFISI